MSVKLTPGAVAKLTNGQQIDGYEPIVQLIECKDANATRYRAVISDGENAQPCVINKENNPSLKELYCIKITDSVLNRVQSRPSPLLTVLKYSVVSTSTQKIGNVNINSAIPNQQPQQQQPQQQASSNRGAAPQRGARGGGARGGGSDDQIDESQAIPISGLNPYSNKWVIKARVTKKGDLTTWKKPDKSGQLFSVHLLDDQKGEIKAIAYNSAAKKFSEIFQEGCVYLVANGRLKHANKKFNTLNSEYEITLEESSIVRELHDDSNIPTQNFNFLTIDEIMARGPNELVDLCAVVLEPGTAELTQTKKKTDTMRRVVKLMDGTTDHASTIELTLWGNQAESVSWTAGDIVAMRGVRTTSFNGVSLGAQFSSQFVVNSADVPKAVELSEWYNNVYLSNQQDMSVVQASKKSDAPRAYRPVNYLSDIKKFNLGVGSDPMKGDIMMVCGTVTYIKEGEGMFYAACPNDECKGKKVEQVAFEETTTWECKKCNQRYENCSYRYIVSMKVSDITGEYWVTAFNDSAAAIFQGSPSAEEMHSYMKESPQLYHSMVQEALFKQYSMRLKVLEDTRGNSDDPTAKVRVQLSAAYPLSFAAQSKRLLNLIEKTA